MCHLRQIPADGKVFQVHHKNHRREDHRLQNLTFLCQTCYSLETGIWTAWKAEKIRRSIAPGCLVILTFPKRAGNIKQPERLQASQELREPGSLSTLYYQARKKLKASNKPKKCEWCSQRATFLKDLLVHHVNHEPRDDSYENLLFLCRTCHSLETGIWQAWRQKKVGVTAGGGGAKLILTTL